MELKKTSPEITLTLDTADGATDTTLWWTNGYIVSGVRCKYWAVQVTADGEFTIYRGIDRRGDKVDVEKTVISVDSSFKKAGTFSYCQRSSSGNNFNGNIFQQSSSPQIWKYYRFIFDTKEIKRDINLNHPGDASYIKYYSNYKNHLYYIVENADTSETLRYVNLDNYGHVALVSVPTWEMSVVADKTDICAGESYLYVLTENASAQELHVYNHTDTLPVSPDFTYTGIYTSDSYADYPAEMRESDDNEIYIRKNGTQLYRVSEGESELLTSLLSEDLTHFLINSTGLVYCEADDFTQTANEQDDFFNKWFTPFNGINNTTEIDAVVSELCTSAGISSDDIDVSALSGIATYGVKLDENYTNDQAIKSIMLIHKLNVVLSAGKLKYITNGGAPVDTIDESKLGMGTSQNSNLIEISIDQGREVPKKFIVQYTSALEQYTRNSQILEMQSIRNSQVESINLSHHSISSTIAKQVCDRVLGQWDIEKTKFSLTVTTYHFALEPGDVINVNYLDDTYTFRITNEAFQYPGLITYTGTLTETELWTSDLTGVDDEVSPTDIATYLPDDTIIRALDIPIISGNDNSTIAIPVYVVVQQAGVETWPGATILSQEGEVWTEKLNTSSQAVIGKAVTVLSAPVITSIIDITNNVTVQLTKTTDTLSTITQAQLLSRENLAILGSEVICFQTATSTANPGEYILSNLHRGVNGSEKEIGNHAVDEVFVLLDVSKISIVNSSVAQLNKLSSYGAYTQGWVYESEGDLSVSAIDSLFGYTEKPFYPVYLTASNSGSDIILGCSRRTRYDYDTDIDGDIEIPLNEGSEGYEFYVYNGSVIIRTIESTSESATYTSAQQVADFGGAQSSIKFSVAQISQLVGAGVESPPVTITL